MYDIQLVFEELEPADHACCYARQDVFGDTGCLELIKRSGVHVFHAIVDTRFDEERAVEFHDFGCDGAVEDVEFHEDGVEFGVF